MYQLSTSAIDLTSKTYGYWTVLKPIGPNKHGSIMWLCRCRCGVEKSIDGQSLRKGISLSCRCKKLGAKMTRGETRKGKPTPEFSAYHGAKGRCCNANNDKFPDYGGRGIKFLFESFEEFLAEVGRRPSPKHTLNRINNDGHYEPGNVEWADATTQSRNRRNNISITANGKTQTMIDWSAESGLKFETIVSRIYLYHWCHQCAVTLPVIAGTRQCLHSN